MSDLVLWPCEMALPNNLRAGDIVREVEHGTIGLVKHNPAQPGSKSRGLFPLWVGDVTVEHVDHPWSSTVTNNSGRNWEVIPEAERSHFQRLVSFGATWQGEDNREEWEDPFEWEIVRCLLTDAEFDVLEPEAQWPDAIDLARAVARKLDALAPSGGESRGDET